MTISTLSAALAALAGVVLAAWVLIQSREQRVRWAFAIGMLMLSAEALFSLLCLRAGSSIDFIGWEQWRLIAMAAAIPPWLIFSLVYVRGDADQTLKSWRVAVAASVIAPLGTAVVFRDDIVVSIRPLEYGFLPTLGIGPPAIAIHLMAMAAGVLVLMNLERTFRASIGTMRWRIKFMIIGLGVVFVVRLLSASHALLFQVFNPRIDNLNSIALVVASVLIGRTLLRSGQFEIELYPSQSILRNSVTIILVGGYLAIAGATAKLVGGPATGLNVPRAGVVLLVAGVFLTIALMSDRLRHIVARFVSRHFQRPLYDYRSVWRQFTEATSSPSSLEELGRRITRLSADIFQVQSVSLWIYDSHDKSFSQVASTAQPGAQASAVRPTAEEATLLHQFLSAQTDPVGFEHTEEEWAGVLRRCHPAEFKQGGNRFAAPLRHRGEPMGVLLIGDRIASADFGAQDLDMLKCVADHVCASLLNVQLSRQLLQARELAAFQTMAAFFVHDIKNAASTLNLMLPNLRTHWDTPGFREDALRGITKTVEHMNSLVQRLSQLRGELTLNPRPALVHQVVADVLAGLPAKAGVTLERTLSPVPMTLIDAEQLRKVVTNLVLNAYDAIPGEGRVEVRTAEAGGWISLKIIDTGKGMAPEFLQKSLFRPFQTTKKGGLGIGMYHTRMIIEAHGGRIGVVSQVGNGTTFEVLLPVRGEPPKA
ncbi:XrtA/PEP-CTERM system histidine kinase PrsK [Nibricoccus sp. IMCC34717]|uniref:XrtA/PEP-CTERM system histidine kinase PrsK n=1 Tax=Nibricoccus sp. IMCC34717 TaxID=3034021 RepID=UPI00384BE612